MKLIVARTGSDYSGYIGYDASGMRPIRMIVFFELSDTELALCETEDNWRIIAAKLRGSFSGYEDIGHGGRLFIVYLIGTRDADIQQVLQGKLAPIVIGAKLEKRLKEILGSL